MIPVGVDVSKLTLDVQYSTQNTRRYRLHCSNDLSGWQQIEQWLQQFGAPNDQIHACLEATSTYGDAIAHFLHERGYRVSIVNATRVARFRKAEPVRGKTDRIDAWILARYVEQKQPILWTPFLPHQQKLHGLVQRLEDIQKQIIQESNRLENQRVDEEIRESIQEVVQCLRGQEEKLKRSIQAHIEAHEELKQQHHRLVSIVGIGSLTAARILSVIGPITRFSSARKLAAFAGVTPSPYCSGTSVKGADQLEYQGTPPLRTWLYMPALSAKNHDPAMHAWAEQLKARGQKGKQTIVAVMRKLIHIVYGVLTRGQDYDRTKAFPWWNAEQERPQEVKSA